MPRVIYSELCADCERRSRIGPILKIIVRHGASGLVLNRLQ